jgi:hypothetical protein
MLMEMNIAMHVIHVLVILIQLVVFQQANSHQVNQTEMVIEFRMIKMLALPILQILVTTKMADNSNLQLPKYATTV